MTKYKRRMAMLGLSVVVILLILIISSVFGKPAFTEDVESVLQNSVGLEISSLGRFESFSLVGPGTFEHRRILGGARLSAEDSSSVLSRLRADIKMARMVPFSVSCHYPHHLLTAQDKGKIVKISLCFECSNYSVLLDDEVKGSGKLLQQRAFYDRLLLKYRVPLPPKSEFNSP